MIIIKLLLWYPGQQIINSMRSMLIKNMTHIAHIPKLSEQLNHV